jgi:hypothetical protein
MTVVRRGLLPSRSASRPDSADLESGRPARVRSPWQRAKGWGGRAGRSTTSGDDHADHGAGQQRTAISHHESVTRSVIRPPIVQFPLRLSPHDPALVEALHRSRVRGVLGEGEVGPGTVVVGEVQVQRNCNHTCASAGTSVSPPASSASSPRYWPTACTPTMPGVRARRWSGNWPPNPESDVSAPVEL